MKKNEEATLNLTIYIYIYIYNYINGHILTKYSLFFLKIIFDKYFL